MSRPEITPGLFATLARASPWQVAVNSEPEVKLPNDKSLPYTMAGLGLIEHYCSDLLSKPRWRAYQLSLSLEDLGLLDMDVQGHVSGVQTLVTAQATIYDAKRFYLGPKQFDLLTAGALLHDLGEARTEDITYDLKTASPNLGLVEAEAAMEMIDAVGKIDPNLRFRLKELYLKITTSLANQEITGLLKNSSVSTEKINWEQLRALFKLYERYGYLITALWVYWPLEMENGVAQLTKAEKTRVKNWNRGELETALESNQKISQLVKRAILMKNVLLNQWPHLVQAALAEIPSAGCLFDNPLTNRLVFSADRLMDLNLDLSFFRQTR